MNYIIEEDFETNEKDELTLHKGDIVTNVAPAQEGWMFGFLEGKQGIFPSNFGKPLQNDKQNNSDEPEEDNNKVNNVGTDKCKKKTGFGFGNIFSAGKIHLRNTKDDTEKAVEVIRSHESLKVEALIKAKVQMAKVIKNYTSNNSQELNLVEGDMLTVLGKEDDCWWKGKLLNGKVGLFSEQFVQFMHNDNEDQEKEPKNLEENEKVSSDNIIKPVRPVSEGSNKPPILSKKPVLYKRLSNIESETGVKPVKIEPQSETKTKSENDHYDKVDSALSDHHMLLVGPNASRAKRPGKKVSKAFNTPGVVNQRDHEENSQNIITENKEIIDVKQSTPINKKDFELLEPKLLISNPEISENEICDKVPEGLADLLGTDFSILEYPEKEHSNQSDNFKVDIPMKKSDCEFDNEQLGSWTEEIKNLKSNISILKKENSDLKKELFELRMGSDEKFEKLNCKIDKIMKQLEEMGKGNQLRNDQ